MEPVLHWTAAGVRANRSDGHDVAASVPPALEAKAGVAMWHRTSAAWTWYIFVIFQAESGGEIFHFCFILNVKRFMYVYVDIIHEFDFGLLMGLTDDTHTLSWAEGQSACVKMAAALWLPNTQPREDCKVRTVFSVKLIIKKKNYQYFSVHLIRELLISSNMH